MLSLHAAPNSRLPSVSMRRRQRRRWPRRSASTMRRFKRVSPSFNTGSGARVCSFERCLTCRARVEVLYRSFSAARACSRSASTSSKTNAAAASSRSPSPPLQSASAGATAEPLDLDDFYSDHAPAPSAAASNKADAGGAALDDLFRASPSGASAAPTVVNTSFEMPEGSDDVHDDEGEASLP